jgi:hypothetical protein
VRNWACAAASTLAADSALLPLMRLKYKPRIKKDMCTHKSNIDVILMVTEMPLGQVLSEDFCFPLPSVTSRIGDG